MVLGNIDNFKGTGLVAFIDILGFAKEIEEKWDNLEDNPLQKLLSLKEKLPKITNEVFNESDRNSKTKLFPCRVQTISDSIIVSFGFDDPLIHGDLILATMAFLYTISDIWTRAIELGFTVRGAADIGQIFWDSKEIIGPSFLNVYQLEQKYVKTSRILISSSLNKTLAEYFGKGLTRLDENILKMLRKDIDGYIIFNPHSLYSDQNKQDIIGKLQNMQNKSKGLEKEKYTPLLAILTSNDSILKKSELGKY
ncbi:MAG: hypothetical protein JST87_01075 [Bacteroidetes bacterium]|nr:hypothetical protein [Bacteroidota bacterium]